MNNLIIKRTAQFLLNTAKYPMVFISIFYLAIFVLSFFPEKSHISPLTYQEIKKNLMDVILFITIYWFFYNVLRKGSVLLLNWIKGKKYTLLALLYPPVLSSLNGLLFIFMLNLVLFSAHIESNLNIFLEKIADVLLILIITNVLYKIILSLDQYIKNKYIKEDLNNLYSRKINTQLYILKKVVISFLILSAVIAITMLFDSVKGIGMSLLTTAGVISAVGAFASQQSLSRLFSGLQIAFTQPIRIGDTVVIDSELGQVEEITLSFITVKLWDLRRLILPTDYFTNKGLINLTRESSELLGTISLQTDYTLPVDHIRRVYLDLLKQSTYWNKKTAELDVTNFFEKSMEIRCLLSADDSTQLWKLRCEIREKLIKYIITHYPECLSISRNINIPITNPMELSFKHEE